MAPSPTLTDSPATSPTESLTDLPPLTPRELRPLLGRPVTVQTVTDTMEGVLLSCVQRSVWIVVDDTDVVVRLDEVVSVRPW